MERFRIAVPTLAVAVALTVVGPALFGQAPQAAPGQPAAVREEILVTASRMEQPLENSPVHTTVIDAARLEATAAMTVDDSLRQVPGFSLFRRSSSVVSHPTTQGVSLRGIGPSGVSRTLVLVDGIPLNDPFGGWVYWSRVSKESVDRIEVVRGGGSSAWGSAALGGVIQLLTRPDSQTRIGLLVEAGERATAGADLGVSGQRDRFGFSLTGNWFDTDGYQTLRRDQRGAIDVPAFSQHSLVGARLSGSPSDSLRLFVRGDDFSEDRGNGTAGTTNGTDGRSVGLGADWVTSGGASWTARLWGQNQDFASTFSSQADDRSSESPALDQFLVDSEAWGASLQWTSSARSESHALTAGVEARGTTGATNEDFRFVGDRFLNRRRAGGDEQLAGIFLQDNWSLGNRVALALGARVDSWESTDGVRSERVIATSAPLRDEHFADRDQTQLSPRLGVVVELGPTSRLRAAAYRAFRSPTINELFRPFRVRNDITEANAALEPETLTGAEVGVGVTSGRLRFDVTGFWNQLDEPISNVTLGLGPRTIAPCGFVPAGGSCRQRRNLDRTKVLGAELELGWRASSTWGFEASYLYDDATVTAAREVPALVGKRLAQVPEDQLAARVDYTPAGRFRGSLQGRYVGEQFEDDQNVRALADFVVVDLVVAYQLAERWGVFAAAENVTDEAFEVAASAEGLVTIGAPRLIRVGVRLRLAR